MDLTRELADRAGALGAQADEAGGGRGVDKVDPMVAAISDVFGEPVLTENVAVFEALGVGVETDRAAE